jgi:hypothetical protein
MSGNSNLGIKTARKVVQDWSHGKYGPHDPKLATKFNKADTIQSIQEYIRSVKEGNADTLPVIPGDAETLRVISRDIFDTLIKVANKMGEDEFPSRTSAQATIVKKVVNICFEPLTATYKHNDLFKSMIDEKCMLTYGLYDTCKISNLSSGESRYAELDEDGDCPLTGQIHTDEQ